MSRPRAREHKRSSGGALKGPVSSPTSSTVAISQPERRIDMTTRQEKLGKNGPSVFPIALGCMGMDARSWYGSADEAESVATIHEAIERGVNVIDTGDFYSMGKNELLVGRALQGRRDQVLLSVKFGA